MIKIIIHRLHQHMSLGLFSDIFIFGEFERILILEGIMQINIALGQIEGLVIMPAIVRDS